MDVHAIDEKAPTARTLGREPGMPTKPTIFRTAADFRAWLDKHHATAADTGKAALAQIVMTRSRVSTSTRPETSTGFEATS
jgi:hypothetical protein